VEASSAEPIGDLPVGMDVDNSAAECMELADEGSVGVIQVTAKKSCPNRVRNEADPRGESTPGGGACQNGSTLP